MASKNIYFNQIAASIRKPGKYAEFNTALAVRTLPGNLQRTLIIGQRLTGGTVAQNIVTDVFSDSDAATYFGRGSMLHRMVRAALKANPYLSLQCVGVDDAAGVSATGTIVIAGPATSVGVITVLVGAVVVTIPIASGDAATAIATALKAQFDAQPDLPVTATVATSTVTLTARHKGTLGNGIKISATSTAAGVTATPTAMASGATDPVLATTLATVFASGHNIIVCPWNDSTSTTALRTHLDSVSGPLEKRGCIAATAHVGTVSAADTLASAINSGRISMILVPAAYDTQEEIAAAYGAVIAFEEDPARPLNTLALTGIAASPLANRLSRTEQETALYNGVTPTEVGPGEVVQIVRAITTYVKDPQAIPDISLLDLTTIRTLDYARKAWVERISLRFPRAKKSARVKKQVREELLDVAYKLQDLEILEAVEENEDGFIVEDDLQDPNRLDCRIPADVVNGLHVVAMRIDLLL